MQGNATGAGRIACVWWTAIAAVAEINLNFTRNII
jgi:hypothetical protein